MAKAVKKIPIVGDVISVFDEPKAPKIRVNIPPPPAPPAPPAAGEPPKVPTERSEEAQAAEVQALAEADLRRRRSTYLSGITKEKFGSPADTKRASLFGGSY